MSLKSKSTVLYIRRDNTKMYRIATDFYFYEYLLRTSHHWCSLFRERRRGGVSARERELVGNSIVRSSTVRVRALLHSSRLVSFRVQLGTSNSSALADLFALAGVASTPNGAHNSNRITSVHHPH